MEQTNTKKIEFTPQLQTPKPTLTIHLTQINRKKQRELCAKIICFRKRTKKIVFALPHIK